MNNKKETLSGIIESVVYTNPNNDYAVIEISDSDNNLITAVGTMAIILVFLVIGIVNTLLPSAFWLRYVFDCVSIFTRFQTFVNGYFDLSSILYYLSITTVFVYLTIRVYDRRRYN